MIIVNISENDINSLHYERYNHPHPRVMQKMEVIYLKGLNISNDDICRICRISKNTLRTYFKDYIDGGIDKLKEIKFYGKTTQLIHSKESIETNFMARPPHTIKQAAKRIAEITGITRSLTQTRKFMLKMGMKRIKTGAVPGKANPEEQEEYKKKRWMFA